MTSNPASEPSTPPGAEATSTPAPGRRDLTADGAAGLAALLDRPGQSLLAFDADGTLAPLAQRPDAVRLVPGAREVLTRLSSVAGGIAVVTGRPVDFVTERLGLAAIPGLVVAGQYGLQRWSAVQGLTAEPPHPGLARVRAALTGLLAEADPGVAVEDKQLALVVHTRPAGDPAAALERLRPALLALAQETGLDLLEGRFALELRPHGTDKGSALRDLLDATHPFAVLYAGDDLGDLPAFDLLAGLRERGLPVVLIHPATSGEPVAAVAARADLVVDGPPGLVAWLEWLADGLEGVTG